MREYPSNSNASKMAKKETAKTEEKKIEKVVTGATKVKKKSGARKLADSIISEDASSVKSYIFADVLIPAVKKLVADIVKDGIEMILYGGTRRDSKRDRFGSEYVSYDRYSNRRDDRRSSHSTTRFDYDELIFETRGDVEAVRGQMLDIIDRYGFVTVADLYDMADRTAPYTGNRYGWMNLRNAEAVRVRDGYILKLPRAVPID